MANPKILEQKQLVIDEIKDKAQNSNGVVLFDYRGLTDAEIKELKVALKEAGSAYKVYKNTLMQRAFNDLNIDINEYLNGPSALAYSTDQIAPIKVLANFMKKHPAVILKVGIIDNQITSKEELEKLSTIPSREGLLTMLAGGMLAIPKDLAICLDLYSKQLEEKNS
ncbi:MAG: 50S ribosomal protein L10 [Bacilli bacterium]|nr:50S ribosomal protein L10 [Bacilli bacterium]